MTVPPKPPSNRLRWPHAGAVLAVVAGAHWAVLGAATQQWNGAQPLPAQTLVFDSRILDAEAPTLPRDKIIPQVRPRLVRTPSAAATTPAPPSPPAAQAPQPVAAAMDTAAVQIAATKGEEPAPPPKSTVAPATPPSAPSGKTPQLPQSVRLLYDIKGEIKRIPISANGELNWRQDGKTYDARLEISIFLLGSRIQTSKGLIGLQGLEPVRFGDKVRSEVAAHFERGKGKVTYSANTPDEVLQPGAQDQLSIFFQLAGLLAADPDRYGAGASLSFQAVGPRSSEIWVFKMAAPEPVVLPGGKVRAIRLTKDPVNEYDSRAEVWLAPDLDYLPVRIRLTQGNGDVVDQLWRATDRPAVTP